MGLYEAVTGMTSAARRRDRKAFGRTGAVGVSIYRSARSAALLFLATRTSIPPWRFAALCQFRRV